MRNYLKRTLLAAAFAVAAQSAIAADTFMVQMHGLAAVPRGIDPPQPSLVVLENQSAVPIYVDLRGFVSLRYQVQGASCGYLGCNDYDIAVRLYVSFDDGTTWAPLGGASVTLTPRSGTYRPAIRPSSMVSIPLNQRRNNALLQSMVSYEEKPFVTVADQYVQFYR